MTVELRRDPTEVGEELSYAEAELIAASAAGKAATADYLRGVIAALKWVGGRDTVSPASLKVEPHPDWRAQRAEAMWAGEIETGTRPMPEGMNKDQAGGILNALMWTSCQDEEAPA